MANKLFWLICWSILFVQSCAHLSAVRRRAAERSGGDRLLLRTKRQHCTCLNVRVGSTERPPLGPGLDPLSSTYRCTCNTANNPQAQQRELQQILQQVEPLSRCACAPAGAAAAAPPPPGPAFLAEQLPEQQQWECQCQGGVQQRTPPPQFFPWNRGAAPAGPAAPLAQPTIMPPPPPTPSSPLPPVNSYGPALGAGFDVTPAALPMPNMGPGPVNSYAGGFSDAFTPAFVPTVLPSTRAFGPLPDGPNSLVDPSLPTALPPTLARGLRPGAFCPCMEVTVNVIRADANGNRIPLREPLCLCEPLAPAAPMAPVPSALPPPPTQPFREPLAPPPAPPTPALPLAPALPASPLPPLRPLAPLATPTSQPLPVLSSAPNMLPVMGASPGQILFYPTANGYVPTASAASAPVPVPVADEEPPVVPCIMITIGDVRGPQHCSCSENYRQCSATQCCNHRYRSMKANNGTALPTSTSTSATPTATSPPSPSAMDLFMEFVDRFRQHLDGSDAAKKDTNN